MNDLTEPRSRHRLFEALLVAASLLAGYLLIEIAYRGYLYYVYVVDAHFAVKTIDVSPLVELGATGSPFGIYQPRKPITLTSYDESGNILEHHTIAINNFGWVSQNDYSRAKPTGEYRIAIIGDSMTASVNNERAWPDTLQTNLNADRGLLKALGVEHISVLNLGVAGASMQFMAYPLALIARRFSADLVVVNFILDDLRRRHGDAFTNIDPRPTFPAEPAVSEETVPLVMPPHMLIDEVGINFFGCSPPYELWNLACRVSPLFVVPHGTQLDTDRINRIKSQLGAEVFRYHVVTSKEPLLLLEVLGHPAVERLPAPNFLRRFLRQKHSAEDLMSDLVQTPAKEEEDLEIAERVAEFIKAIHHEVMFTHNPSYWQLTGQIPTPALVRLGEAFERKGIELIRMEKYLPTGRGQRDWYGWYNLPHDGHWSDFGADIYADAVYKVVREKLISTAKHN
jgi:hypothetical protein